MIKIWGRNTSSNVQKVMWAIGEIGLPHERIDIGGPFGKNREAAYLAMNPNGLVPTLEEEDGFLLWESNSIVRYLAAKHRVTALEPVDLHTRARASAWMDWQLSVFAPAITPGFVGLIRTPPEKRDHAAIEDCKKENDGSNHHSRRTAGQDRLRRRRCFLLRRHSCRGDGQSLSAACARATAAAQFRAVVCGYIVASGVQGPGRSSAADVGAIRPPPARRRTAPTRYNPLPPGRRPSCAARRRPQAPFR